MWQQQLDIQGMYLSLLHLHKLGFSPCTSNYIDVLSDWNHTYEKWGKTLGRATFNTLI